MKHASEDIIEALKNARKARGLSQRALSERTGVPQSHISKIEQGNADIRLSSLIELARALELELKLVPRKALPAVESVVRTVSPPQATTSADTSKDVRRALDIIAQLRSTFPDLSGLRTLQEGLQIASHVKDLTRYQEQIRSITKPIRDIQKQTAQLKKRNDEITLPASTLREITQTADVARQLRSHLANSPQLTPSKPRPAYRLDDDDIDFRQSGEAGDG
ncbi:helix-turn-helix domain-containing protein [Jiella pacifica]|uniref:Helix-turn-helix domain-containing protein n=1 Tax=Jiella pacifica TaxID=2696469 RepID=A0A6N9TAW6_9HYPH|nr:helix-turn-helix transcriptional regulator [Jiella pacifica]NDW07702.1 helix-turn-helix domain-containing protein [Jiella pacifica]